MIVNILKKIYLVLLIVALILLFTDCGSGLKIKTHTGILTPTVYELIVNDSVSYFYYNGDCCCVAKDVLEQVKADYILGLITDDQLLDKEFVKNYLVAVCKKLKGIKR